MKDRQTYKSRDQFPGPPPQNPPFQGASRPLDEAELGGSPVEGLRVPSREHPIIELEYYDNVLPLIGKAKVWQGFGFNGSFLPAFLVSSGSVWIHLGSFPGGFGFILVFVVFARLPLRGSQAKTTKTKMKPNPPGKNPR